MSRVRAYRDRSRYKRDDVRRLIGLSIVKIELRASVSTRGAMRGRGKRTSAFVGPPLGMPSRAMTASLSSLSATWPTYTGMSSMKSLSLLAPATMLLKWPANATSVAAAANEAR